MASIVRPIALVLVVVNVAVVALWLSILHPGASPSPEQAAGEGAVNAPANGLFPVPLLIVPGAPRFQDETGATTIRAPASSGATAVAQLDQVPADLSQSTGAIFPSPSTPQAAPQRVPNITPQPALAGIDFRILTEVRYQGSGGTVYVSVTMTSAAALSWGLRLGNTQQTLPDGTTAWVMSGLKGSASSQIRWLRNGLIVTIAGDVPIYRLTALAASVTLK